MPRDNPIEHRPAIFAAAFSSALLCLGASAPARASEPDVSITIFAEQYVLAGTAIDDLDVLEAAVVRLRPQSVQLSACGAERAQRAAAHRLRAFNIELRRLSADSPHCRAGTTPRAMSIATRLGPRPYGIDDAAVDRWWHDQMP